MKMMLSKAEQIMALLNQWDPEGRYATGAGYRSYSYEGETIAQSIRKNSRLESVEEAIADSFAGTELDKTEMHQIANVIRNLAKRW